MNVPCVVLVATLAGVVARSGAFAQEPVPTPPKPQEQAPPPAANSRAEVDQETVRLGTDILREHAERSRAVQVLVAGYVQKRTTKLSKEPLVSIGRFTFVRDPACVVFRAKEPRETVTRLRRETYEVYRPQKKQLERFVLPAPVLANTLFAAIGGDADVLLRDFTIRNVASSPGLPGKLVVALEPRDAAVREHVSELGVVFSGTEHELSAVWYRDHDGDRVEIQLVDPVVNPKDPPSVELDLAPDTTVIEHAAKKR